MVKKLFKVCPLGRLELTTSRMRGPHTIIIISQDYVVKKMELLEHELFIEPHFTSLFRVLFQSSVVFNRVSLIKLWFFRLNTQILQTGLASRVSDPYLFGPFTFRPVDSRSDGRNMGLISQD